jgi:hypothetical protein
LRWFAVAALPAGVAVGDFEGEVFELGEELADALVVAEPGRVVVELVVGEDPGGGAAVVLAGPLVVGAVGLRGVGAAAAAGVPAAGGAVDEGAGEGEPCGEAGELGGDGGCAGLLVWRGRHGSHCRRRRGVVIFAFFPHNYCMSDAGVLAYIASWAPEGAPPEAGAFARAAVAAAGPASAARAEPLLWAAGRLAAFGMELGLDPVPEVLLHPSVIDRFTREARGLKAGGRSTARSSLRFIAARVVPRLCPPRDVVLTRDPPPGRHSPGEIAGFLALADAQGTRERRARLAGLVCLAAGAGLGGGELAGVRGTDVQRRSGGVLADVRGPRARAVPVLAPYQGRLLAAAAFAGEGPVLGAGRAPGEIVHRLLRNLDGGGGLPALDVSRLRAAWKSDCAARLGLAVFLRAAGAAGSLRLADLAAGLDPGTEEDAVALLGARSP